MGCQDDAGHHAQLGEHLAHNFQAGFLAGGCVHAAHNVGCRDLGGIQDGARNRQRGCTIALSARDQSNAHRTVIIEAGGIVHICGQRGSVFLHHQLIQQDAGFLDLCHAIIDLHGLACQCGGVLCRVQNVNQDNGRNTHHLKAGAHSIAKGVLRKVIRVANRCRSLLEGACQQRGIDCGCGVSQQVDRGGAHNDLQAGIDRYRRGNAGCGLGFVKTMRNSHLSCPPYFIRSVALL